MSPATSPAEPLLSIRELAKSFRVSGGTVRAVNGVSFDIARAETVGLVGESGCGKSTLGKTILRLIDPDSGSILLAGEEIGRLTRSALRPHRRRMQMIFQDPYASLNPRITVGRLIQEPMDAHKVGTVAERKDRVVWLMQRVGLRPEHAERFPHEFSGGQRQRIGIARALALNPDLLICDEPVSALDLSVQAQVLNLLVEIQEEFKLSLLFISHDLSVVAHLADRIMVMYLGHIVEIGTRDAVWEQPLHPYTRALISAVPRLDPDEERPAKVVLSGDLPSPMNPPAGCPFHTRCPVAIERCSREMPALRVLADGSQVACHLISR
ncbi:ABC transporter ATP-binding protein [Reyranella sp.]|uniref:ABC transporter ATP-binding protein n=1 Tax=Reyranella sp. TaxID=1929291 RepID=UPI003D0A6032